MSILSGAEILRRMSDDIAPEERLVITPLLDPKSQIKADSSSVDVRLGTDFVLQERTNIALLDPKNRTSQTLIERRINVPFGKKLILHPNQFVLGASFEYFSIPPNMGGYVIGRSSWGRMGLIVATATGIHPGYKGVVTLELRNIGEVPISLYPIDSMVAQIFFHTIELAPTPGLYGTGSRYALSTTPQSGQEMGSRP